MLFKDGPSGRRAALAFGPDVWEIVKVLREIDEWGEAAVSAAAEVLALAPARVRAAMHYYGLIRRRSTPRSPKPTGCPARPNEPGASSRGCLAKHSGGRCVRLLLDEMHAPTVAASLRDRGHDVVAVAEQDALRALSDEELFRWASERSRRIVTENVKGFVPLLRRAEESGRIATTVLFTSSRSFPRSRRNPGPFTNALDAWLQAPDVTERPAQDWLADPK